MKDIFQRLRSGELVKLSDPEFGKVNEVVARTLALTPALNAATSVNEVRERLSDIIGSSIDVSTTISAPLHTNFGQTIKMGKHIFINHACSFLNMGDITLKDYVLLVTRINLVTENHPLEPSTRQGLIA